MSNDKINHHPSFRKHVEDLIKQEHKELNNSLLNSNIVVEQPTLTPQQASALEAEHDKEDRNA
jgi:hypothetical protein